ncbi:hypothetical protein Q3G72_014549 [Acer saccharum]|nr:hypothetical protein Q3G72_014549 [Acer saccharum]
MAAGVMLVASFDLIQEGQGHGASNYVVFGILAGGVFILLCKKILSNNKFRSATHRVEYQALRMRNKTHPLAKPEDVIHITHYAITS